MPLSLLAITSLALCTEGTKLTATGDFPGGAAEVVKIDDAAGSVRFRVPKRNGWKAWWYVRVGGITPGQTLRLELEKSGAACAAGRAVYSLDGRGWHFTGPAQGDADARDVSVYRQRIDGSSAAFAWYVPYLPSDANQAADAACRRCPRASRLELCRSEDAHAVVGIRFGDPNSRLPAVWVQGRQHAWELGGSWTAQGLIDWLSGEEKEAKALRSAACVTVVPVMDADGAYRGEGGKDRRPHDHNRDWTDKPHWRSVAAAQAELKKFEAAGRLALFLDLHDPGWGAKASEFWCSELDKQSERRRVATTAFFKCLQAQCPPGDTTVWPIAGPKQPGYLVGLPASGNWVRANTRPEVVAGTIEIPVSPPSGFVGDPPGPHLELGRRLGLAIERYLASRPGQD